MKNTALAAALRTYTTLFPEATPQQQADMAAILRDRGKALDAMIDEVKERVGPEAWAALEDFQSFCADHCRLHLEFFRHPTGLADYRYRPMTADEAARWCPEESPHDR